MAKANVVRIESVSNDGSEAISFQQPFVAAVQLVGSSDFLFHRWSNEAVAEKAAAAKNSKAKKSDNIESYVYRCDDGTLAIPGEYVRQSCLYAAKYKQDPRSPRKSAFDLFKAGIVALTPLASVGQADWDYLDRRRVVVQRNAITRERPALRAGWVADFELQVLTPEYIDRHFLHDVLTTAGRLIGVGDFRPTYGRFNVTKFEIL